MATWRDRVMKRLYRALMEDRMPDDSVETCKAYGIEGVDQWVVLKWMWSHGVIGYTTLRMMAGDQRILNDLVRKTPWGGLVWFEPYKTGPRCTSAN